jgi:hypothetical protein
MFDDNDLWESLDFGSQAIEKSGNFGKVLVNLAIVPIQGVNGRQRPDPESVQREGPRTQRHLSQIRILAELVQACWNNPS